MGHTRHSERQRRSRGRETSSNSRYQRHQKASHLSNKARLHLHAASAAMHPRVSLCCTRSACMVPFLQVYKRPTSAAPIAPPPVVAVAAKPRATPLVAALRPIAAPNVAPTTAPSTAASCHASTPSSASRATAATRELPGHTRHVPQSYHQPSATAHILPWHHPPPTSDEPRRHGASFSARAATAPGAAPKTSRFGLPRSQRWRRNQPPRPSPLRLPSLHPQQQQRQLAMAEAGHQSRPHARDSDSQPPPRAVSATPMPRQRSPSPRSARTSSSDSASASNSSDSSNPLVA